jgi:hypothetical protein
LVSPLKIAVPPPPNCSNYATGCRSPRTARYTDLGTQFSTSPSCSQSAPLPSSRIQLLPFWRGGHVVYGDSNSSSARNLSDCFCHSCHIGHAWICTRQALCKLGVWLGCPCGQSRGIGGCLVRQFTP